MSNKPLNISDEAKVQMPMKTVVSLITMVAIGTWAYFGIIETQNKLSTQVNDEARKYFAHFFKTNLSSI